MECLLLICWLAGILIANGWEVVAAILVPPYAWYLTGKKLYTIGKREYYNLRNK